MLFSGGVVLKVSAVWRLQKCLKLLQPLGINSEILGSCSFEIKLL